jgi:NADPH2:quinone reductase
MKYVAHGPGKTADSMRIEEAAVPQPGVGEILIKVHYAGVNRPDVMQRASAYPPPADASSILGLEVAGAVVALGAGVTLWRVGDLVTALVPGGGYAEYCVTPAVHALPIPTDMGLAMAAGLPENWFTVWANVMDLGHLKVGERLLVHGGSSGIGLTAIQLAHHVGAEVLVTVGNQAKADFCTDFGAAYAINYRQSDFAQEVRARTGGEGVDVVLDMIGAEYLTRNLSVLRRDGRLVLIAFIGGTGGEIDLREVMSKRLCITGSAMRPRTIAEKAAIRDALLRNIWPDLASGRLKAHLHATFPLAEVAAAHRLMEASSHIGKIVLAVRP